MTATTFIHANSGVTPTSGQAVVEAQFIDGDGNPVDIGGDAPTWADIPGKPAAAAAIADLTAAPTAADVNKILAALRAFGVIAK